jgi:uncharacterized protein YdcH (DUF465 family)
VKGPFLKDLYAELQSAKDRKSAAMRAWVNDPEYKRLSDQLDSLGEKLRKADEPKIEVIDNEIRDLQRQIIDARDSRDKITPAKWPKWFVEFIAEISKGVDWGMRSWSKDGKQNWQVRWVSDDERFVIVTQPGHKFWSARSQAYGQAEHWLVDQALFRSEMQKGGACGIASGMGLAYRCCVVRHQGGRLSAFRRAEMIERAKLSA